MKQIEASISKTRWNGLSLGVLDAVVFDTVLLLRALVVKVLSELVIDVVVDMSNGVIVELEVLLIDPVVVGVVELDNVVMLLSVLWTDVNDTDPLYVNTFEGMFIPFVQAAKSALQLFVVQKHHAVLNG